MTKTLSDVGPLLRQALSRARSSGRRLLSVTVPSPAFDPITVFEHGGDRRGLWLQPASGFALVSLGATELHEASGEGRFREIKAIWHALTGDVERIEHEALAGAELPAFPLALSAFAFKPAAKHPATLPDAMLVIPRLTFLQSGDLNAVNLTLAAAGKDEVEALEAEVEALLEETTCAQPAPSRVDLRSEGSREQWCRDVESILAAIERRDVEKVVLARTVRAVADQPFAVGPVLRALAERNRQATVFAYGRQDACFLGATPERLVSLSRRRVQLDCLAGSIKLPDGCEEADTLAEHMQHDAKELHEHEVVVRAIKEALAPVCEAVEAPSPPLVRRTADVQHLHTLITATAGEGVELFDLVERLHPTPAVGGYPREEALRQIEALESFERGWYASPLGWVDADGNGDFAVAIRSALIEGNEARLYAGNGIVHGSDPEREFEETELKLKAMLWALRRE